MIYVYFFPDQFTRHYIVRLNEMRADPHSPLYAADYKKYRVTLECHAQNSVCLYITTAQHRRTVYCSLIFTPVSTTFLIKYANKYV
jgi:hypothetical protein